MKQGFSLRQTWMALVLLAVIVPVMIILIWQGQHLYQDQLSNALLKERHANELLRNRIGSEVKRFKTLLINKSDPLSFLLDRKDNPTTLGDINSLLVNITEREQTILEVMVLSKQAEVIAATHPMEGALGDRILSAEELQSVAVHWGFDKAIEYPEVIIPLSGRDYIGSPRNYDDYTAFSIAIPIGHPVKAVLVAIIDVDKLWPTETREEHGIGVDWTRDYILDRRGSLITEINGSDHKPGDLMTHLEITRAALSNSEWPADTSYIGAINEPVYGTKTLIPSLNWTLVSEVIASRIKQPIFESLLNTLLFSLLGMIVLVWFVLYLTNKTLKPIQSTCKAIDHASKGDYQFRLKPCGIRELDAMSMGFNHMANEILGRTQSINNIALGISGYSGDEFFREMVMNMGDLFYIKYVFVAVLDDEKPLHVNTIAISIDGNIADNINYSLKDTPCETVMEHKTCVYPDHVQQLFPKDTLLQEMGVNSYIGSPIFNSRKEPVGLIGMMDTNPLPNLDQMQPIMEIFAARTSAELERMKAEEALRESEARFRQLAENINQVFWLGSVDWNKVLYVSPAYEKYWGLSAEALYEDPRAWIEAVHPDDREQVMADIPKDPNDINDYIDFREYRIQKPHGDIRWVKARAYPIQDDSGKIARIAGIAEDITERKQAEEALIESEEKFRLISEQSMLGIVILQDDVFKYVNQATAHMIGYDVATMMNWRPREWLSKIIHPADMEFVIEQARKKQLGETDVVQNYTYRSLTKSGRSIWVEIFSNTIQYGGRPANLATIVDISERKRAEEMISKSAHRLAVAQSMAHIGSWELDLTKNELWWSDEIYRIFEVDPDKFGASYDAFLRLIHPDDREFVAAAYAKSVKNKTPYNIEHRLRMPDGAIKHIQERCETSYDDEGNPIYSSGTMQDITEQVRLEESLRRSQKMDSLGKLTGGIAHDFNNMLGVVLGYAGLLESSLSDQPKLAGYVDKIYHASERGAKLTRKLLAFSRQKASDEEVLNINTLLQDEQHMLEKTLTARIQLELDLADDLWPVCMDSGDLEDAIVNLSINAMHAINGNGQLTIQTANERINSSDAQPLDLAPGDYVVLNITDTGCGMDDETKENIFDPFYTTKGDKGTGLGLSQVYGFIERSGGTIKVYSEPDRGTRFALYFPRYDENAGEDKLTKIDIVADLRGTETILVVDDEPALLDLSTEILSPLGYTVLCAENGQLALNILQDKHVDLLLSDVIMPDMDGYKLAATVQEQYPAIKVLLASGFTDNHHIDTVDDALHWNLLHKPYRSQTLVKRIRELLDS